MIRVIALEQNSETQSVIVAAIEEAKKRGVRIYVNPYSPVDTLDQFIASSERIGGVVGQDLGNRRVGRNIDEPWVGV